MKNRTIRLVALAAAVLGLGVAIAPGAQAADPTIVDRLVSKGATSSLVAAVQYADANAGPGDPVLLDVLSGPGPFTLFAPTNAAFADLLGGAELTDLDPDVVRDVLLDHVVAGSYTIPALKSFDASDTVLPTLGGLSLDFDASPFEVNDVRVNRSTSASNGRIVLIEGVLIDPDPRPTIVDRALATPDLSSLVAAVLYADTNAGPGDPVILDVLSGPGAYTVFAPTNAAFAALLGGAELTDLDPDLVRGILLDHVVARELDADEVARLDQNDRLAPTLGGLDLEFVGATVNGVSISAVDIEASNGTVHVIDAVLV